jgi:hypothetical protein
LTRLIWLLPCWAALGCGLQVSGGVANAGSHRKFLPSMTTTATLEALRNSNSVVALRVNSVVDDGYRLKSAMLHAGYDVPFASRFAVEGGLELGAGKAVHPLFGGTGAYSGASGTLRVRPYPWVLEPAYNLAFPMVEVLLMPRAGFWMPPEDSGNTRLYGEYSFELGLRLTLGSDLVTTGQGAVWDGGPPCGRNAGGKQCTEENP